MAQVKLLKISTDGLPLEFNSAADDVTLNSYTVQGGGPVLSSTGLDMNNTDVSDVQDLDFTDPSTATIDQTAGPLIVDDLMFQTKENSMAVGSAILFPAVADTADEIDAFRLPTRAGTPTATPGDGGEGYGVWDSSNDVLYIWDGAMWVNQSQAANAGQINNSYTAGEILLANDFLYISASDTVSKVVASGAGVASRAMGFAKAGAAASANVNVVSEGVLSGFSTLTAGDRMYADPATAGAITSTVPAGAGNTIVQAGYAKNGTTLHIHIEQLGRRA